MFPFGPTPGTAVVFFRKTQLESKDSLGHEMTQKLGWLESMLLLSKLNGN